jgi:hypothetical protein
MERWERREKKLEGKRSRMEKHGRSILTAISGAERRREEALRQRSARRASRKTRAR